MEGVKVSAVINQPMSCLHDYTLSVGDMKIIEGADVIVMNGVGLEDFMDDALAASSAMVIDSSEGVELLPYEGHEDHDHGDSEEAGDHFDPHIWMDPGRAAQMVENIGAGLALADPLHAEAYQKRAQDASAQLLNWKSTLRDIIASDQPDLRLPHRELITFHDGLLRLLTWTFSRPLKRRRAARPAPPRSGRSCRSSAPMRFPPSLPRSMAPIPPHRPLPAKPVWRSARFP